MSWILFGIGFFLFVLGAVMGSFLNVVIYRTVEGESWIAGRSRCDSCRKKIHWYDNIPLLSYLLLKGRCRFCHKPIPLTYPFVEFLMGSLFVWWYLTGSFFFRLTQHPLTTLQPLFWLIVGVLLVVIFIADWLYYLIPDFAVISLFILIVAYRVLLVSLGIMRWHDFLLTLVSMVGLVTFFAFLWWVTQGKGFGFGDVKFAAPMALLLGWPKVVVGTLTAFIVGSLVGIVLVMTKKKKVNHLIPFGPFLVFGIFVGLVWGEQLWRWYWEFFTWY